MKILIILIGFLFIANCGAFELKDASYKDKVKIGDLKYNSPKKEHSNEK